MLKALCVGWLGGVALAKAPQGAGATGYASALHSKACSMQWPGHQHHRSTMERRSQRPALPRLYYSSVANSISWPCDSSYSSS